MQWLSSRLVRWICLGAIALCLSLLPLAARSQVPTLSEKIFSMEGGLEATFERYFAADLASVEQGPAAIAATLERLTAETGTRHAVLWAIPRDTHLHLVLITPGGEPFVRDLDDVPRARLARAANRFNRDLTRRLVRRQQAARQLYRWLIEPVAEPLETAEIDTILFCFGDGLRGLPVAALFDGEQFLVEQYSSALIPAFNLIDTDYQPLQPSQVLAMGASEFSNLPALPAVPVELETIAAELRASLPPETPWGGQMLLNEAFTLGNLRTQLAQADYAIIHLATHAEFQPGAPGNSYIQFWDDRLSLEQMGTLDWRDPPLELLVLSACRTALGDEEAELGFAGVALQAGVKSALASRWYVSDAGTLALMSEFYNQLPTAPTKAEALRQAQLQLLQGGVQFAGDRLQLSRGSISLPEALDSTQEPLNNPFYWAGFTLISSPW